jgi:hypothetical protein
MKGALRQLGVRRYRQPGASKGGEQVLIRPLLLFSFYLRPTTRKAIRILHVG